MTDYAKTTNFAAKDSLPSGDSNKIIRGTEFDVEFEAIETSVATKANLASPALTGTPTAPTAALGTNTTQIATTAFVQTAAANIDIDLEDGSVLERHLSDEVLDLITGDTQVSLDIPENSITTTELNVADTGTAGQVLVSDGDGSMSWEDPQDINDLAAGAEGILTTPPVGAVVLGNVENLTSALTYGEVLNSPNIRVYTADDNDGQTESFTITAGNWRFLGGVLANGDNVNMLLQRVS